MILQDMASFRYLHLVFRSEWNLGYNPYEDSSPAIGRAAEGRARSSVQNVPVLLSTLRKKAVFTFTLCHTAWLDAAACQQAGYQSRSIEIFPGVLGLLLSLE